MAGTEERAGSGWDGRPPRRFEIAIPQAEIDDLRQRLLQTRWPDKAPDDSWKLGTDLTYLRELVRYWEGEFKTLECCIMDLADDIAYSTFDLEDSLKAGFLSPADILSSDVRLLQRVAEKVSDELNTTFGADDVLSVFTNLFAALGKIESDVGLLALADGYRASRNLASSGYLRTELSSQLVGEAIQNVVLHPNTKHPMLSAVSLSKDARAQVEVLKQYTFLATIYSSRVKLPEFRGYEVVSGIFEALSGPRGNLLMPEDVRAQHEVLDGDLDGQMRLVCDFVAGMTDRYAMEFYGRLHSDSAQSMFKPI